MAYSQSVITAQFTQNLLGGPDMERENGVETTLGELIVALTEETSRHVHDEKAANILVAYILSDLFHNTEPISKSWH